ncbi:MAG: arginine--tRNA ligase [Micrococcales bacterium]|nr:MAG: arginine--tRNA ligase [Micrococcales bacterium]
MPSLTAVLIPRVQSAIATAFGPEFADADPVIRDSKFADVQINAPLALAKRLGRPPREVAAAIMEHLDLADVCDAVEVSGPGFINLTASAQWVSTNASEQAADPRTGLPAPGSQRIVIDYSAPNVAKEMHVGHLRTTIVGDALARILQTLGHTVIRQNHIGDWGTPFGMLIEHLLDVGDDSEQAKLLQTDPNTFYQQARSKFDSDPAFAERSRNRVVALQAGDARTLALWEDLLASSRVYFNRIYSTLGVTLTDADLAGESTYNPDLPQVCAELEAAGLARISEGALCAFPAGFTGRDDQPMAMIVRKSDGGYGYATTDLATIRHRVSKLGADRILYVVGATQALHLQMVFATAREAGWLPADVEVEHVQIGSVLGADNKMLKTRSGDSVKLMDLLTGAIERAGAVLAQLRPELPEQQAQIIAAQIGIGAVKYADLSVAHDSGYTFDFDRMLALTGNTGPYLQYAVARIRSMFRRAGEDPEAARTITVTESAERDLALLLASFGDVVTTVAEESAPHKLCNYLYEVATAFSTFYENCPVLKAAGDVRESRLSLSALTMRVLVTGLDLLGVQAPEQM